MGPNEPTSPRSVPVGPVLHNVAGVGLCGRNLRPTDLRSAAFSVRYFLAGKIDGRRARPRSTTDATTEVKTRA